MLSNVFVAGEGGALLRKINRKIGTERAKRREVRVPTVRLLVGLGNRESQFWKSGGTRDGSGPKQITMVTRRVRPPSCFEKGKTGRGGCTPGWPMIKLDIRRKQEV